MTVVLAGGVALALLVAVTLAVHRVLRKVLKALNPAWLWLSGHSMDGASRTNATWTQPSHGPRPVLHPSGHAVAWHHLPRLHRAGIRTGASIAFLAALYGLVTALVLTLAGLSAAAATGLLVLAWHAFYRVRYWRHERHYVRPLERTITAKNLPAPVSLEIERDGDVVKSVAIEWAAEAEIGETEKQLALEAVTARLAIEAPDATWQTKGRARSVTFTPSQPPPGKYTWDVIASDVAALNRDELMIGLGKRGGDDKRNPVVSASLESDSPHLLIAMGTGGGKSNLAAFWLVQRLQRGDIALILDAKHHSHPWTFKDMDAEFGLLPNVRYCRRTDDLHDAMVWLGEELDRRNQVALRAINARGDVLADVGPRLFIVAEELNLATPRLKQYWADIRTKEDVKKSPALTGMGEVAFAGRAVKMHLIVIGQMMTAEALGGGAVRENMGIRTLARYTQNSWKMMAGDTPMPPSPSVPGRVQCLASGTVREAQVPLMDLEQARELALGGVVTPCPAGMPGSSGSIVPVPVRAPGTSLVPASDLGMSLGHGPFVPAPPRTVMTLSEAHAAGMFGDLSLWGVRKVVQRAKLTPAGERGTAHEYEISDLYALARK